MRHTANYGLPGCTCLINYTIFVKHYRTENVYFISVNNQLDAQNFCFTMSLFHASTCLEHMCSKRVKAWNKLIVKQKFCASSWLITEINILRCTVSKTSKFLFWYSAQILSETFLVPRRIKRNVILKKSILIFHVTVPVSVDRI